MALLALVAVAAAGHAPSAGASHPSAGAAASPGLRRHPRAPDHAHRRAPDRALMSRVYKDVPLKESKGSGQTFRAFIAIAVIIAVLVSPPFHGPNRDRSGRGSGPSTPRRPRRPPSRIRSTSRSSGGCRDRGRLAHPRHRRRDGGAGRPSAERCSPRPPSARPLPTCSTRRSTTFARGGPAQGRHRRLRDGADARGSRLSRGASRRRLPSTSRGSSRRSERPFGPAPDGLFERAKYSPHEIDAKMKEEAIDALSGLRDELRPAVRPAFFTWLLYAARGHDRPARRADDRARPARARARHLRARARRVRPARRVVGARPVAPREHESLLEEALERRAAGAARIAELERLEREVALAAAGVRPPLPAPARAPRDRRHRLERRGSTFEYDAPAPPLLGDELWELSGPTGSRPRIVAPRSRLRGARRTSSSVWNGIFVMTVDESAERRGDPRRGRARRRRQARGARARAARPPRRRPRPDRGLPRAREDADRALVRAGDEHGASRGSSSRPT